MDDIDLYLKKNVVLS